MKTMKIYLALLACLALIQFEPVQAQDDCNCAVTLTPEDHYIDGGKYDISPGDTICLMAGHYKFLNLRNFHGSKDQRITFINCGGQVVIGDPEHYYGVSLQHNTHFRFTGTGSKKHEYGIKILDHGLTVSGRSTDFEIDHIESYKSGFAGIMIKMDPKCDDPSTWRENFEMQNVKVHHNLIEESHGEGLYIGYSGNKLECEDEEKGSFIVFPHLIKNIHVYKNKVLSSGWDGLQVSKGVECEIYDNYIINYAKLDAVYQKYGMILGGGTSGKIYNNEIIRGSSVSNGSGMAIFATRDNIIFNNIIVDAGEDGIFWDDRPISDDDTYDHIHIFNNTIIRPARDGIRTYALIPQNSKIYNNLIVAPGSLGGYQYVHNREYLFLDRKGTYDTANNVFVPIFKADHFSDAENFDFGLMETSPAKDAGVDVSEFGVTFDFVGNNRPNDGYFDAGAIEYYEPLSLPDNGRLPPGKSKYLRGFIKDNRIFVELKNEQGAIKNFYPCEIKVYELTGREIPVVFEPVEISKKRIRLSGPLSYATSSRLLIIVANHGEGTESLKLFRSL